MNRQQWTGRRKKEPGHELNIKTVILLVASGCLILFGVIRLIGSAVQQKASEKTDKEMRALYHTEEAFPTLTAAPAAVSRAEPSPRLTEAPAKAPDPQTPEITETPAPSPVPRLEERGYPGNPGRNVNVRFRALREQNRDIIG